MGWDDQKSSGDSFSLTPLERQIILEYRRADEIAKAMVLRALSIDKSVIVKGEPAKMA